MPKRIIPTFPLCIDGFTKQKRLIPTLNIKLNYFSYTHYKQFQHLDNDTTSHRIQYYTWNSRILKEILFSTIGLQKLALLNFLSQTEALKIIFKK